MAVTKQRRSPRPASKSQPTALTAPRTLEYPRIEAELLRSLKVTMHPSQQERRFGLLCVRVDASDSVNALLGARGVERLLKEAFARLRNFVRTTDLVSTGPGNIFFILATDLQSEDDLEIMSDRIQRTCRQPYWIQDHEIYSDLTTGGVGGSEGKSDPATLTQHAVLAMRRAASRGVAFETFSTNTASLTVSASDDIPEVPEAEPQAPFELKFQPQVTRDLSLAGAQVGIQMPSAASGKRARRATPRGAAAKQLERFGDRVLRKLLLQARAWADAGLAVPPLSIEIGANHILNPSFADSLLALLTETGTQGATLELLLTEATTLTSLGSAQPTLAILADAGVRFGLSGFSLSAGTRLNLRKLPFSSLRVRCGSLFKATSPHESLWLARSIVAVAQHYGLTFVGEDVETESQQNILLESGCERFEGPFFSPSIGPPDMEARLREGHGLHAR